MLLYDMARRPSSFDIIPCISTAMAYGETHVRFVLGGWKPKNYNIRQAEERYASIVEPSVALFGLTHSVGEREGKEYSHYLHKSMKAYNEVGHIGMIKCKVEPKDYCTITLRKSRTPQRNSKEEEWLKFANKIGKVIIIRDYEERPITIEDRMKLYAGARMNFFISNGPLALCIYSEAPYLCMRTIGDDTCLSNSPKAMAELGITEGFQFPWANERQRLSYLDDTCENIEKEYASLTQERMAA